MVLAVYAIQLPSVQTLLAQKATNGWQEKSNSVSVGTVQVVLVYGNMTLEDVNIKDLKDMITIPKFMLTTN
jgi:hypothetical protein